MAERSSAECNSHETHNLYPNSGDQRQFRLNKINGIKYYFVVEIKEIELMSKRLSKYIAFFDYFDKSLIVLSVTTDSISIASFATVIGAPAGIVSVSFSLAFLIIFFCLGFLSRTFTNHKTAVEKGGHFFNSLLPILPASQTLRC